MSGHTVKTASPTPLLAAAPDLLAALIWAQQAILELEAGAIKRSEIDQRMKAAIGAAIRKAGV